MGETPNRYGAHSNEQEQWVLNGELHSGNPASQRESARSASAQPEPSAGQMPRPESANGESNASFGGTNGSSPDFGGENSPSPSFPEPPRKFPVPPGYERNGSDSWHAPSGLPRSGGPGDMGPGSFSGLGDNPVTPPKNPKSRALPITVLVVGIVLMLVVAPIAFVTMLVVYGLQVDSSMETHPGVSSITRTADYQGTSLLVVEASNGGNVRCDATFNGDKIESLSGDNSFVSGFASDPDNEEQHTFIYNLNSQGTLKVKCEPIGDKEAVISSIAILPNLSFGLVIAAFVVPTIIGFTGLGLLIWGIVWTVKRGRDNRQALINNSYYR
ncbi:hypothetical protein [Varibaculum cambriense]|uniref:hypothetical protein n=1 Tax=Varibaculum cambriense TaxID=184870 RepID=UPI0028FF188A|nr:hypothetical protein [Varibaculum cambriense]MDU1223895.1 hypothetical protein [Varibaculum cambriense]